MLPALLQCSCSLSVTRLTVPATARAQGPGVRGILLLAVPMAFDLVSSILLSVGLLTTSASVSQMLRGSGMVFSALFAVTFLRRSLNRCLPLISRISTPLWVEIKSIT